MTGSKPADTLVIDDFIFHSEQAELQALAAQYRRNGILEANASGPLRYRRKIHGTEYCTAAVQGVADKVIARLKLQDCAVDPYLGWIISYIEPGGFIKPHMDRHQHYQQTDDRHLRCNILVQGDNASAYPVIEFLPLMVKERGLWAFFASEQGHSTVALRGDLPRIVFQFGFVVPATYELR